MRIYVFTILAAIAVNAQTAFATPYSDLNGTAIVLNDLMTEKEPNQFLVCSVFNLFAAQLKSVLAAKPAKVDRYEARNLTVVQGLIPSVGNYCAGKMSVDDARIKVLDIQNTFRNE